MDTTLILGKGALTVLAICSAFLLSPLAINDAYPQNTGSSGKEVVDAVCAECHRTGENNAPKIGDESAWAELAQRGLTALTQSALRGIRDMPAHGGDLTLSDFEIAQAITFMVNQSGGEWIEPVAPQEMHTADREASGIVQDYCADCHETGVDGAPEIGDLDAWIPRIKRARGFDALVRSAIHGHGAMPARGGVADLTDSEIRTAILYMYNPDYASGDATVDEIPKISGQNYRFVAGMEIILGIMAADSIRSQYPEGSPERSMHEGAPEFDGFYHINISILDAKSGELIENAKVKATVKGPVGRSTRILKPMTVSNTMSYGNYFRMPDSGMYTITIQIRRPGALQPTVAEFNHEHSEG